MIDLFGTARRCGENSYIDTKRTVRSATSSDSSDGVDATVLGRLVIGK